MQSRVVITIPGVGSNGLAMAPLRRYLAAIGHDPFDWGLGRNDSRHFEAFEEKLIARVAQLRDRQGDTIDLIGWSLGGMLARATARALPDTVRRVITYGTPVVGGPRHTVMAGSFDQSDITEIERRIAERRQSNADHPRDRDLQSQRWCRGMEGVHRSR